MSKQDVDKLVKLAESFNGLVDVGEKVFEDGKLDFSDLNQVKPLGENLKKLYEAAKAYKEMVEEAKDIDAQEAIQIVSALFK